LQHLKLVRTPILIKLQFIKGGNVYLTLELVKLVAFCKAHIAVPRSK